MATQVIQPSLTGGELAPALWGRVDLARYQVSLKTCRNFIVQPYGGCKNRPGLRYICEAKDSSKKIRLIPFTFNSAQTYVLEFGDFYIRIISEGGRVVLASAPAAWGTGTVYTVGNHVLQGGTAYYCRTAHTSGVWATDLAAGKWYALTASGSDWIVEIPTTYAVADLPLLKYAQNNDVITLVHPSYPPRQLGRLAHDSWTLTDFPFVNGPWSPANFDRNKTVTVSGVTGSITITCTEDIFAATDVGRMFYVEQNDFGQPWEVSKSVAAGETRRSDGKYYKALNAGTTGTLRPIHSEGAWSDGTVNWQYLHSGYGSALITAYTSAKVVQATVVQTLPEAVYLGGAAWAPLTITAATVGVYSTAATITAHGLPTGVYTMVNIVFTYVDTLGSTVTARPTVFAEPIDANTITVWWIPGNFASFVSGTLAKVWAGSSSYKWALGAWGGVQGYPAAVCYHQQRAVFAGTPTQPSTIWMSRTGNFYDFGLSQPIQDDDPITATLASPRMDPIRVVHPMGNLITLTAGAEWASGAGDSDVLTPSNTSFKLQGYRGCSNLPAVGVGGTVLYLQNQGQVVRDLSYEFASNNYLGQDLTIPGAHLTDGHYITDWAWHQTPHACMWAVREDGILLGLTYMREQQVAGWHRHDTDGLFESVAVVSEGSEDYLYAVIKRVIAGQTRRFIERMDTRLVVDARDAFFVDSGLSFDGTIDPATGATWAKTLTITGGTLWDETETLTVTASGAVFTGATDIGDRLVFYVGDIAYRLRITAYTSPTVVSVRSVRTIPAEYRGVAFLGWEIARDTFSGLDHLEGKTVSILADGTVQAEQTVISGRITLDPPAAKVHAGLSIQADLETLDLSVPGVETLLPKTKAIAAVTFYVQESQTLWAGRWYTRLDEAKVRGNEYYDTPTTAQTGKVRIMIDTDWSKSANVCVRMDKPLPINILAIIPEVSTGGA